MKVNACKFSYVTIRLCYRSEIYTVYESCPCKRLTLLLKRCRLKTSIHDILAYNAHENPSEHSKPLQKCPSYSKQIFDFYKIYRHFHCNLNVSLNLSVTEMSFRFITNRFFLKVMIQDFSR